MDAQLTQEELNARDIIDMICSLQSAIAEAHGLPFPNLEAMRRMSLAEFVTMYAPNGIRFRYTGGSTVQKLDPQVMAKL